MLHFFALRVWRRPTISDKDELVELGNDTGIFEPGEAHIQLGDTIDQLLNGTLAFKYQAHILEAADGSIRGWMYFGPTQVPQTWTLWWIGVPRIQLVNSL